MAKKICNKKIEKPPFVWDVDFLQRFQKVVVSFIWSKQIFLSRYFKSAIGFLNRFCQQSSDFFFHFTKFNLNTWTTQWLNHFLTDEVQNLVLFSQLPFMAHRPAGFQMPLTSLSFILLSAFFICLLSEEPYHECVIYEMFIVYTCKWIEGEVVSLFI